MPDEANERRRNGLSPEAPSPGQLILVPGGAGYIGCVLVPRLLARGYRVRVLDRLYFGKEPLAEFADQIDLVVGDVRELPDEAFDGVDGVINLSGLSNDPTAEFNPQANWEMNAVGTEKLGRTCLERGIERYVFASSCSLYDGLPPGMHGEDAPIRPRAAYATSKRYGEERLLEMVDAGLCPVILRNGTVYGWSPRMRFDLVVNTFVKDALTKGRLTIHYGGEMWRPLAEVHDAAGCYIALLRAPKGRVNGQIFNLVNRNFRISELALRVREELRSIGIDTDIRADFTYRGVRSYRVTGQRLEREVGFRPTVSVEESVRAMVEGIRRLGYDDFENPRYYNITWMRLLEQAHDVIKVTGGVFDAPAEQASA